MNPYHCEMMGTLVNPRWRVKKPFVVVYERVDDGWNAEAPQFNEFGTGKDTAEARDDLLAAIAELCTTLRENERRLGPGMEATWEKLCQHFEWRDPPGALRGGTT